MKRGTIYQITIPGLCAGVMVYHGTIVDAAPILRWMLGKSFEKVREWVEQSKGGTIIRAENLTWKAG